jgi:hypothetical protein
MLYQSSNKPVISSDVRNIKLKDGGLRVWKEMAVHYLKTGKVQETWSGYVAIRYILKQSTLPIQVGIRTCHLN